MKFLIASDIHGSEYYCKKLLSAVEKENPDKVLLLGDILYHGPRNDLPTGYNPKAVAEMLNSISERIICVKGNCDSEVDDMVLSFPVLAEYALVYADGVGMYLTHGHKNGADNPPNVCHGTVVLSGHTHIPLDKTENGVHFINPGSVSIPKNGSAHSYAVFENGKFTFRTLN